MSKTFHRIRLSLALMPVLLVVLTVSAQAGIGFQVALKEPPRLVSGYDKIPNRFSAALYPKTYKDLPMAPRRGPTFERASFEQNSLTFNTSYHRTEKLIPISVDAEAFLNYRIHQNKLRKREELVFKSIEQARTGNRRKGLSIGVALPKRFDRIFGEGGGNLRVSGYRRITFSGRSQWVDAASTDAGTQSKFPSLIMEQISRFDITGTIGTKITVSVSQDSQTDIPLANRLLIRYKGDDDDILKTIEAGNTTLSLPRTQFVGYAARIQGLFGIKTEAQLGNLRLTAIASQEKGSSESASITPSGEENAEFIRDYQYSEGRIFDLGYEGDFEPNDRTQIIRVYELDTRDSAYNPDALLYINPKTSQNYDSVRVKLIEPSQYEIREDPDLNYHIIHFNTPRRYAVAVYMEVARGGNVNNIDTIGAHEDTPYKLKLLRALDKDYTKDHPTWALMWRNCYRIPRGVDIEEVGIKVFRGAAGREGTSSSLDYQTEGTEGGNRSYLEILGLDQYNHQQQKIPDTKLDDQQFIFESEWGLVIFPNREPFNSTVTFTDQNGNQTPRLHRLISSIYSYESETEKSTGSEYFVQITSRGGISSTIRLNRANIIENSERVTANGELLSRGTDYSIQYDFGTVTLLSDRATDPNADIKVDFEYAPFLAVQKKTLLGLRAEYLWSKDLEFGATVLYKSDKAEDRKPRVGQETSKMLVYDFDAGFRLYPNFLTKAIDALPLISTEATSGLNIQGEIAQSRPNPNVEGKAYIDDFESAQDQLSLGTTRTTWTASSRPALDANYTYQRGKLLWHNPPPIAWEDVYESERAQGEGSLRPMRLAFRPNNLMITVDTLVDAFGEDSVAVDSAVVRSWGGIIRYFGNRVDSKRAQLFEIRVNGREGILHFDFGKISEDVDGENDLDTEDADGNNSVTEREDVGLDGIIDTFEVDVYGRGWDPAGNPDPKGDNWWFEGNWPPPVPDTIYNAPLFRSEVEDPASLLHYEWVNGTEGNRDDPLVLGIPDEEVLSNSGMEKNNSYFSFSVDLSDDRFLVEDSENKLGWRTYRIPIRDPLALDSEVVSAPEGGEDADIADPSWSSISHVRVWMETEEIDTHTVVAEIAAWHFVQANWQDSLLVTESPDSSTSKFFVASVSDEENINFTPPPGVDAYFDKQNNITEAQRALALIYDSLVPGDTGLATKDLVTTEAYSGYRRLEMYVHGPSSALTDSVFFFFRLGRDHENFYEQNTMLVPGWDESNDIEIDFNEITAIKDSALRALKEPNDPVDVTSGRYRVVGRPNINEIRFFATGVVNKSGRTVSGEVWLDELRVTDVRNDVGTAVRLNVTGSLADLMSYNVSVQHKDPYFRGLSTATRGGSSQNLGSGATANQLSMGATLQFHRFLPRSWEAKIPISLRYAKSTSIPLLRTNSDIVLAEDVREAEKSVNETRSFSVSESFRNQGRNPLFTVLLNRQKASFSYTRSAKTSVTRPYSFAENYSVRPEYDMSIKSDFSIPIFAWTKWIPFLKKTKNSRLYLFPNTWRWNATYTRSLSISETEDGTRTSSFRRALDGRMNMSYKILDNLTTTYGYSTKRDLTDPEMVKISLKNPIIGRETNYSQNFKANYDPRLFSFLGTALGYTANYSDGWDRTKEARNASMSRSWTLSGSFKHIEFLGGSGRGRRSRGSSRGAGRRSTSASQGGDGSPFYDPPLAVLRFLTGWIDPVSYKYAESYKSTVPALRERPSYRFRFGLTDTPDVATVASSRNPSTSETVSYSLNSGFKLLGGISTNVGFKRSLTRDLIKIGSDRLERASTGWPELGISISQFSYFPLVKKYLNGFIKVFSPRTSYSRQVREDVNLERGFVTARTESIGRSPLLALNFKLLRALSLSGSYGITNSNTERFNPNNGDPESETRSTKKTINLTSKYSFSSPGGITIPLFGKMKFKSIVTISVRLTFSSDFTESSQGGGPFTVTAHKSDFSISPVISYTFSQQIKGGLSGRWQDSNDIKSNRRSHVRQLQIWAEIRF